MMFIISFLVIGIFILVLQFIDKKITENQDRFFYENEEGNPVRGNHHNLVFSLYIPFLE